MKNKKTVFRRILSLFLAMALCTGLDMTAFAQTADAAAPQAQSTDVSPGDIVSFGSYPQTEVTGNALTNEIINAEYDGNGDAVVNGQKYRRYKEDVKVTKDDYETYVKTYHSDDSSYGDFYWNDYYNQYWNSTYLEECEKKKTEEQGTYHYFKWEPIKWKVLENETEEGTLFVMANTVLDAGNYNGEYSVYNMYPETVSWEESDLCQWMNTDAAGFYQTAFDSSEKENIKVSDRNPGKKPIYLLSDEEVKNTEYGFEDTDSNSNSRVMYASAYAAARGAAVYNKISNLQCSWFLRTSGQSYYVKNVSMYGGVYDNNVKYYKEYQWNPYSLAYERTFNGCVPVMHIDASSVEQEQDPDPDVTGVANPEYTFTGVDGSTVSTTSTPGQATVIIFGNTTCLNTKPTLGGIAVSEWVSRSDIRVIFAETNKASSEEVQSYAAANTYGCEDIIFCYDEGSDINAAMWKYYGLFNDYAPFYSPLTVLIDGENRVRHCLTGMQRADTIMSLMEEFVAEEPPVPDVDKSIVSVKLPGTQNYDYVQEVLSLVNEARIENELPELQLDSELLDIAMQRAAEIAMYYSHTRPDGTPCFYLSNRGTYRLENIALGYGSPAGVMSGWLNSPGHRANIMNSQVTSIGIGCFRDSQGMLYWVQFFDNDPADTPSVSGEEQVTATVRIQKGFLHLQTDLSRTFNEADRGTTIAMTVWQENEEYMYSKPELSASVLDFSSSDTNVATVDKDGMITLKEPGTAVITASLKEDASVQVEQTITIEQNAPSQSSAPEQTSDPSQSSAPGQTFNPGQSSAPGQTSDPGQSSAPGQTSDPGQSSAPGQTSKPGQSSAPGQTSDPSQGSAPGQTSKPGQGSAPQQTTNPIQGSTPGTSTVPGQEPAQRETPAKNSIIQDASGNTYQVTQAGEVNGTVAYVEAEKNQVATANVPSQVTIDNITYEVTSISAKAFRGNTKLKKVIIGKNVSSIGNSAFEGCTALKSIVIPSKVKSVGKNAFKNCKKLKSIQIKGNVLKTVGKNAFKGIHAKAKIKVPKKQLKAYKKLLKGKGQKKTVKITK